MAKGTNNSSTGEVKVKRGIAKTLLMSLLPIILVGIIGIIVFISLNARSIITEVSLMDLQAETDSNARKLGVDFQLLTSKNDQYCDTLETVPFEDHAAMYRYCKPSLDYQPIDNTGIYIGFSNNDYFFANDTVQASDWKASERGWYN